MYSINRLIPLFMSFTLLSFAQALREVRDMKWKKNPAEAWPFTDHHFENRVVILLLNIPNYLNNNKEWTFITTGVLLDNSRILTSYNPYKQLIHYSNVTDNILALMSTGVRNRIPVLKISNIVCGRQIAYVPDELNDFWRDKEYSPIHDLMVLRMEEEIGIADASTRTYPIINEEIHNGGAWWWAGQSEKKNFNSMISFPARFEDVLDPEVQIFTLGYLTEKHMQDYDTLHEISYEADDAAVVDCDEWLPRQWGFFICITNIGNFPGIGSGATLFSNNKLFGIGNFAMFKNNIGILVFTDVRIYEELIEKTCGDEEFSK